MFCYLFRRKLSLYVNNDLTSRARVRVDRHLHACHACRLEVDRYKQFRDRLLRIAEPPPPEALEGFSSEVITRIERARPAPGVAAPASGTLLFRLFRFQRLGMAAMLAILAVCALIRYTWVDEMLTTYELQRSIVTRDGRIVSDARLHGRDADVTVVKDSEDMVIIWLKTPSERPVSPRRG